MISVTLLPNNTTVTVPPGTAISDVLSTAGVKVDFPCGGNGTCGKCRVKVNGKSVLACQTKLNQDSILELPSWSNFIPSEMGFERFNESPDSRHIPPDADWGVAVDIGTTTIESTLVCLDNPNFKTQISELNDQKSFGADVISRIHFEQQNGKRLLHETILRQIERLNNYMANSQGVSRDSIKILSVTGNTAMLTWFLGESAISLGEVPFEPAMNCEGQVLPASEIGLNLPGVAVIIPPVIGGFLGGDILGVIERTSEIHLAENTFSPSARWLAVDIGTNGEIALYNQGELTATSTAAGPAFEGAGISIGCKAAPGAIDAVSLNDSEDLTYTTIDSLPATGICGSGLLDLISCLIQTGAILPSGKLIRQPAFPLNITQKDVRQVQLACGAIRTGITVLLRNSGINVNQLDKIYIAGGFGSHLSIKNLFQTGLIPFIDSGKIAFIGNQALRSAERIAVEFRSPGTILEPLRQLAHSVRAVNLAQQPDFASLFTQSMKLPLPIQ